GFVVPNLTSYVAAPVELHVSVGVVETADAPLAGDGNDGAVGGGGGAGAVVKLHSGPWFAPPLLCATICQKYVVFAASPARLNDAVASPLATCDGGSVGPKRTS